MIALIQSLTTLYNLLAKLSRISIFKKFFAKNPKTGASTVLTIILTLVTNFFGYMGWGLTQDQALQISEGIVTGGVLLFTHFTPSPMKNKS